MKKYIIIALLFMSSFAYGQSAFIINDNAVTTSNDTLISSWQTITDFSRLQLYFEIGDSVSYGFTVQYRGGGLTAVSLTALSGADSISSLGSATSVGKGLILRDYTANIIPGANSFRVIAIRKTYSTAVTSSLKVWMDALYQ